MNVPTLLILTFSQLNRDARVLKQVNLFKDCYRVITCSFGPSPEGVTEHIEIPASESITYMNGRLITLKLYGRVYWNTPAIDWVRRHLRGRDFDVILANDYESVGVALSLRPAKGVHADLHEYSPSQFEHLPAWDRRIRPYREWVCRKYVSKADSWTTVCEGLSNRYHEVFGFRASVVTNAAPYVELKPSPVDGPIKLVHHGGAAASRGIDRLVQAVLNSSRDVQFDLYLQDVGGSTIEELRDSSKDDDRVNVYEAVPYGELIPLLNQYDIGLCSILPNTYNLLHALPNKLFDYVQARMAIISGPSPEMARVVTENSLGTVLSDFEVGSLTRVVDSLSVEQIAKYKVNAHRAARKLSADMQNAEWARRVGALLAR